MMKRILYVLAACLMISCACTPESSSTTGPEGPVSSLPLPSEPAVLETYKYAVTLAPSTRYWVRVDGVDQFCYPTEEPDITAFGCNDSVLVEISCLSEKINKAVVRPISKNLAYEVVDDKIYLIMKPYDRYVVEINGNESKPLFLFANPLQSSMGVSKDDPDVIWFEAGKVHKNVGTISLKSGQTVFFEGGAVVEGHIDSKKTADVTVTGPGILNCWPVEGQTVIS